MAHSMFSDKFRQELLRGKYTDWAKDLSEEQMRCVLSIAAEFAFRSLGLLEVLNGHRQELKTSVRGIIALEAMSRIVSYGERFDVNEFARRITRGRGKLEFTDLPASLTHAVNRAAPEVKWTFVLMLHDGYELGGRDATDASVGASVTNDGNVIIKALVEEAAVPQAVRATLKKHAPTFKLHYIHARGPDRQTVHSYEFVVDAPGRETERLVVSADGQQLTVSSHGSSA